MTAGSLIIEHPTEPARWQPQLSRARGGAAPIDAPNEPRPRWPGNDPDDYWDHWHRCVRYVAERCVGGPVETARQLAEDIGLSVRAVYPGEGVAQAMRTGRAILHVHAHHTVHSICA